MARAVRGQARGSDDVALVDGQRSRESTTTPAQTGQCGDSTALPQSLPQALLEGTRLVEQEVEKALAAGEQRIE